MVAKTQFTTVIGREKHAAELDLVVRFTTPELTRVALEAASRLAAGLNPTIRLVRVQVVPYPLQINQSPVNIEFLAEQLAKLSSGGPVAPEIRLDRIMEDALLGTPGRESVVVLAAPKRPWTTRNERLAATLRCPGHMGVLVNPGAPVAPKLEAQHA